MKTTNLLATIVAGFQEIYVTGWPAGIYIAKLIVNNKNFDTVKISVVK